MSLPHGPRPISKNGQIVLPKEVLGEADLAYGDSVYVMSHDDPPGTILVVPVEIAARWIEQGRAAESEDTSVQPPKSA